MRKLLQNPSLLQNATALVTKYVSYYKIRRYYKCRNPCYKMRRHYKMPQNSVKLQSDGSLPYGPTNLLTFSNNKKNTFLETLIQTVRIVFISKRVLTSLKVYQTA